MYLMTYVRAYGHTHLCMVDNDHEGQPGVPHTNVNTHCNYTNVDLNRMYVNI